MPKVIKRNRLPLLVDHKQGAGGVHERIEVDFEQVLRNDIPMDEVGKVRINRGDTPIPAAMAQDHFDKVCRWGAGGSSVNSFIGGEVVAEELNGSLRRFACYCDVLTLQDGQRVVDWKSATPASRWIQADGQDCFDLNKALFLKVKEGGSTEIMSHRQAAKLRGEQEVHSLASQVYAPVLSDGLLRGGPAELALWNLMPLNMDSEDVVEYKLKTKASEAAAFLSRVMEVVNAQFASERETIARMAKDNASLAVKNKKLLTSVHASGVRQPPVTMVSSNKR